MWSRLKPDASVHQPPPTLWVALQKFWKNLPVYSCLPLLSKFTNDIKDETRLKSFVKPSPQILWKCEKSSPVFSSFRKNKAITHQSASQCLWNQNVFPRKRSVSAAGCSVIQSSGWAARGHDHPRAPLVMQDLKRPKDKISLIAWVLSYKLLPSPSFSAFWE